MSMFKRLSLQIKIISAPERHARVLASLLPTQLIAEIVVKFGPAMPYLRTSPEWYELQRDDGSALPTDTPIGESCRDNTTLRLAIRRPSPNPALRACNPPLIFRERGGTEFIVGWLPTMIGRTTEDVDPLVAIDLRDHPLGQHVSRPHACLHGVDTGIEIEGRTDKNWFVIERTNGTTQVLRRGVRIALAPGDYLTIGDKIGLTFLPPPVQVTA